MESLKSKDVIRPKGNVLRDDGMDNLDEFETKLWKKFKWGYDDSSLI